MKKRTLRLLAIAFCFASAPLVRAGDTHAFLWSRESGMQDLGTLGGTSTHASGVNDSGAVVGYGDIPKGTTHAFLWTAEGGMQDLRRPKEYDNSIATAINNKNEICGFALRSNGGGGSAGFYWTAATGFILLDGIDDSQGINDHAWVAGSHIHNTLGQAFLWQPLRGEIKSLGFLPGGIFSYGYDVNDLGNVAGIAGTSSNDSHPMFWSPATGMLDLGVPPTADTGTATAVNEHDEVVGYTLLSTSGKLGAGFYWSQNTGRIELLTLLKRPFTIVNGINDQGMIVGECWSDQRLFRAALWQSYSSRPEDLGTLPGGSFSVATDINNRGQVVGYADVP